MNAEGTFVRVFWYRPTNCSKHTEPMLDVTIRKYWISEIPSQLFYTAKMFLLNILKLKPRTQLGFQELLYNYNKPDTV